MPKQLFRPKNITLAAAALAAGLYLGAGHSSPTSSPALSASENEIAQDTGVRKAEGQLAAEQTVSDETLDSFTGNRTPAVADGVEGEAVNGGANDFFQSGKLDLNLRYILGKDSAFEQENRGLAALLDSGKAPTATDFRVPAGFRLSLRLEPECSRPAEGPFEVENPDDNARALLQEGSAAYVVARTRTAFGGAELSAALAADRCVSAAGADLLEEAGSVSFGQEPLTSSSNTRAYQIMRNAGLVELFANMSFATFGNASVTLGVVDTGVYTAHPDLRAIASGERDDYGHGTMVAGTAAAPVNGVGTMGSMPFHVRIRSFKVNEGGKGSAYASAISNGILRAASERADVINVSWSGFSAGSYRGAVATAVAKGSLVTGSAGNSSLKVFTNVTIPGALSVGALNGTDNGHASYSNYGPGVEIYAPGTYMTTMKSGGYAVVSGTSFSSPLVGGLGLLIRAYGKARGREISPATAEKILMETTRFISTSRGYVKKLQPMAVLQRLQRSYL